MGTGTRRTRREKESGDRVHPPRLRHSVPCAGLAISSSRRLVLVLVVLFSFSSVSSNRLAPSDAGAYESVCRESHPEAFGPSRGGRALPRLDTCAPARGTPTHAGTRRNARACVCAPLDLNAFLYVMRTEGKAPCTRVQFWRLLFFTANVYNSTPFTQEIVEHFAPIASQ